MKPPEELGVKLKNPLHVDEAGHEAEVEAVVAEVEAGVEAGKTASS